MDALRDSAERQMDLLSSSALAALMQGLVGLKYHPGVQFNDRVVEISEEMADYGRVTSSQDALAITYSLCKMSSSPGPSLLQYLLMRMESGDLQRCRARRIRMLVEALVMMESKGIVKVEGLSSSPLPTSFSTTATTTGRSGTTTTTIIIIKQSFLHLLVDVVQSQVEGFQDVATLSLVVDGIQRLGGPDLGEVVMNRLNKLDSSSNNYIGGGSDDSSSDSSSASTANSISSIISGSSSSSSGGGEGRRGSVGSLGPRGGRRDRPIGGGEDRS